MLKNQDYSNLMGNDKLLTPKGAQKELGISTSKIYYWIRNKKFKFYKPSKEILFWKSDLLEWLETNAVLEIEDDGIFDD